MEIKAQITKKLQKYKADEIKTLYQLMLRVLSGNDDFRMVQNADTDDLRPVIEGETGEKIDFAMESIISGESLKLWQDIQAEEAEKVKLKKADRIERIASVMSDAALFEGFCLAFYGKDEMLAVLCDEYGCLEAYEALVQDTVYRIRRAYMRMLSDYVLAASHLYGVVSLHDFELLLRYYEKNLDDFDGYAREEGSYKNTILFQPRYLGLCTLQQLIGNTVPEVLTTMDGLFLHPSFTEDFQKEQKEMVKAFAKNGGQNVGEKDFDQFFAAAGEKTSYRKLLRDTMDKPMYLPTKEEFLKHIEDNTILEVLNKVPVHKGDVFFIPAGTIHAICGGILICEIQQNSNTTYRVYDYNRLGADGNPRPLHIKKAAEVSMLKPSPKYIRPDKDTLASCKYFTVKHLACVNKLFIDTNEKCFQSIIVLDGQGSLTLGDTVIELNKGDSIFIPAQKGKCTLDGNFEFILSYV